MTDDDDDADKLRHLAEGERGGCKSAQKKRKKKMMMICDGTALVFTVDHQSLFLSFSLPPPLPFPVGPSPGHQQRSASGGSDNDDGKFSLSTPRR